MRAILLTFDSLNRRFLEPYGGAEVATPNFLRLARRAATFDNAYVGSMPCMPARREMHTGRYNFLHCGWGGLEPYDVSVPALLHAAGVHTHHATDHYHYWEDGGHHYMQRYSSHEMFRGQEGDMWKGRPGDVDLPPTMRSRSRGRHERQDQLNRAYLRTEADWPMAQTVSAGLDFLERAQGRDGWLLHVETFDPHEPFVAPEPYRSRVPRLSDGRRCDWPPYGRIAELGITPEEVEACRAEYAALVAFCDAQLGRVLDAMDRLDLWKDTLLIVNTDHGFFLGERDYLAKCAMPFFNEVAHTPLFIADPRAPHAAGTRRAALVQTIDLPATLLGFFGQPRPAAMQGVDLAPTIADDRPLRAAGLFGLHGGMVNVVTQDGWVAMLEPDWRAPLFSHTLGFAHMRSFPSAAALRQLEFSRAFTFTEGVRLLRYPADAGWSARRGIDTSTRLFHLPTDPRQERPLDDPAQLARMRDIARALFVATDAPEELYARFGLG